MKGVTVSAGVVVLAIAAAFVFFLLQAQGMKGFCADIRAGESVTEIRQRVAASYSYKTTGDFVSNGDQAFSIRSDWSLGRFTCKVSYVGNKILLARYVAGD